MLYTHDLFTPGGAKTGNFYFELNRGLRNDADPMKRWGHYLKHFTNGLAQLEDWEGTCYRGMPLKGVDLHEYSTGRQILWDGFSSSTQKLTLAKSFLTSKEDGIIFKIKVSHGKDISPYSVVRNEDEVLLDPRLRFLVSRDLYVDNEGYNCIDLVEIKSDLYKI